MIDYVLKLNIKACCLFEQLARKSFFASDIDDAMMMIYSMIAANNDITLTYEAFLNLLKNNKKIALHTIKEYERISNFISQFTINNSEGSEEEAKEEEPHKISDLASVLIIEAGMDAHYVMYEMDFWEMYFYFNQFDKKQKGMYEKDRLFTFIQMSPHINTKKIRNAKDIIKFPWDKEDKDTVIKNINKNASSIMSVLKTKIGK